MFFSGFNLFTLKILDEGFFCLISYDISKTNFWQILFYLYHQNIGFCVESQQDSKYVEDSCYTTSLFPCHRQNQKTQEKVVLIS